MGVVIKINGKPIKTPHHFRIASYNLTDSGRVASGKMTMDLVSKKRKLFLTYGVITSAELKQMLELIDGTDMFFDVEYTDNGEVKTMRAYTGELDRDLHRTGGLWYWKDFEVHLIEQ